MNTDTGSLSLLDTNEQLAGTLNLNADNVWIAQQSILTQLEADPNYAGRDAALAVNSGTSNLNGFVGADTVSMNVSSTLFGQNSGVSNDMAGITVGDGGFSVASTGASPAMITAYGRQMNSDGSSVTGSPSPRAPACPACSPPAQPSTAAC